MNALSSQEKILIVGAGPTGLTAALTLAKRGIKPRIIDKKDTPVSTSNALAIQALTLEMWEKLGIVEEALSEGHRLHGLEISSPKRILGEICLDKLPSRYPFVLILPQAKTERLLTDQLATHGVTVERATALEELKDLADRTDVVCNGKTDTYSWLLGCDGANSSVRQLLKIPFRGKDAPQHFIMADIKIDWDKDPGKGHAFFAEDGPFIFFPFNDQNFGRLIFDVTGDPRLKEEKNPTFEDFKELMQKRNKNAAFLHPPSWISSFWIHSRLADSYRKNALFLAGDAAHQHSPFGGQGLNIGVQDAYFLAKLLADVVEGKKSKESLHGYEKRRKPIGEQIVRNTAFMTKMITTRSKPLKILRNALFSSLLKIPPLRKKAVMTLSQLDYRSELNI